MQRILILAVISMVLLSSFGCHRKFRKYLDNGAESVELAVTVPGRPQVSLGERSSSSQTTAGALLNAGAAIAGAAESANVKRRLEKLMTPATVQGLAANGALAELEGGYPLSLGDKNKSDGLMELSLTGYGIGQQGGGPVFFANYNARIYNKRRKLVYSHPTSCSDRDFFVGYGGGAMSMVGTIVTIKYLNDLSDEDLVSRLSASIDRCTSQVFATMRQHAGRGN